MKKFIAGIVALVLAMTCIPMVVKAERTYFNKLCTDFIQH